MSVVRIWLIIYGLFTLVLSLIVEIAIEFHFTSEYGRIPYNYALGVLAVLLAIAIGPARGRQE